MLNWEYNIPEGWNIATLAESAGEEFEFDYPGLMEENEIWEFYVNGVVPDYSYEIQDGDKIHFMIQDSGFRDISGFDIFRILSLLSYSSQTPNSSILNPTT